jgi:hypothetical protein
MPLFMRKLVLAFMLTTIVGTVSGCVIPVEITCPDGVVCVP